MKTEYSIEYFTLWGETLRLVAGDKKYPMAWKGGGIWSVEVDGPLENYCYEVVKDSIVQRVEWEKHLGGVRAKKIRASWIECPIQGCPFPRKHSATIFDKPGFRGAGVAVPVFSLRSEGDFGIGEFSDLRRLVDWAADCGMCIIQLLPINDTTRSGQWGDSYPYSPISSFALHPLYLNLLKAGLEENEECRKERLALNALPEIDYPEVFRAKMKYAHLTFREKGSEDLKSSRYKEFHKKNTFWLKEYSQFCARRDGTSEEFYLWLQFHLDAQLSEVVTYAHGKGVYLKGDLPIGVGGDGVDAHFHPELFNLDSSAGAPPDYFSADGQNWGFPTYNWQEMAKDDYAWWKARLGKMAEYFDAYRIDHILGFFRIWEIPASEKSGKEGHFNPAIPYSREGIAAMGLPLEGLFHEDPRNPGMYQPLITPCTSALDGAQRAAFDELYRDFFFHRNEELWRRNALLKFSSILGSNGMLACGEDLGMVPECVGPVMDKEKILSLKMKGMSEDGPWGEMSVCATSSHDMPTLRMQMGVDPEPQRCKDVLLEFLRSPSMLAIFPIQDYLSIDATLRRPNPDEERINEPSHPDHHWRFRLHLGLESLCEAEDLKKNIREAIVSSGR